MPYLSLANLKPNAGSNKACKRYRGICYGRRNGRGSNGQKARAGNTIPKNFAGGQTPLCKMGKRNDHPKQYFY